MCYNGKCLHCIRVETGALIWAIISTGSTGLSLVVSFGSFIYFNVAMSSVIAETKSNMDLNISYAMTGVTNMIILIAISFTGISFLFSMFLLMGVIKKRPGYVKAYFIYGVVKSVLFALVILTLLCVSSNLDAIVILVIGVGFGLYSLILTMVHMTYTKFNEASISHQYSHKILVE